LDSQGTGWRRRWHKSSTAACSGSRVTAAEQVAGFAHALWVDVGDVKVPAAEQVGDLVGVDAIIPASGISNRLNAERSLGNLVGVDAIIPAASSTHRCMVFAWNSMPT